MQPSSIFAESLAATRRIFPDIDEKIKRFVATKLPNPIAREAKYGKHDGPMTGPLAGFYHCHLRDDAILIYRLAGRSILMVCVVSHAETEGKRGKKLRNNLRPFLEGEELTWMRSVVNLLEKYLGTPVVETEWGQKLSVEVFENPSKREFAHLLSESEYASVRGSLYPETDTLLVWVGDNVQHHDMDHALYGEGSRYYIRMFFDRSGLSMHGSPEEDVAEMEERTVHESPAVRRIMGKDFEISYP